MSDDRFFSFRRNEAYRLLSSAGVPLVGGIVLEKNWLLDPKEALLQSSIFYASHEGGACDDAFPKETTIHPWDAYDILESLVDPFVQMRVPQITSQADIRHVSMVVKRLRMLIQLLDNPSPSAKMFNGCKAVDGFALDCKIQLAKFTRWADILDQDRTSIPKGGGGGLSQNDFIKGPLANAYERLYGRDAGGNDKGPFARFGVCFFEIFGSKVAPGTIVRAVKDRPRSRKKRPHLRLVYRAA